ncbi:MAG: hypothetical protein JO255_00850 [Alphaproteobacteria bacterium]|nr:hypothetical protein [Alphaproteobacteria bacterium]
MAVRQLFAVTRTRGLAWDHAHPMEEQAAWRAHADFMNGLHSEGLIVVGGPLAGTPDTLLIFRAGDAEEIRARLAADPWVGNGLLELKQIAPWTLRLGALD